MAQHLPAGYVFDPADPRAPTDEQWDAMTPEERRRVVDMLPPSQGDRHLDFIVEGPSLDVEDRIKWLEAAVNGVIKRAVDAEARAAAAEERAADVEGRLRSHIRRVFAVRQMVASAEDEARIAACADVETLRRWHDQAVLAASIADALR